MKQINSKKLKEIYSKKRERIKVPPHNAKKFINQGQYPRVTKNFYRFRMEDPNKFSTFMMIKQGNKTFVMGKFKQDDSWRVQSVMLKRNVDLSKEKWIKIDTSDINQYFKSPEIDLEYIKKLRAKIKSKILLYKENKMSDKKIKSFLNKFYKGNIDKMLLYLKVTKNPNYDSLINNIVGSYTEELLKKKIKGKKILPIIENYFKTEKNIDISNYKLKIERTGQSLKKTDVIVYLQDLKTNQILKEVINISVKTTISGDIKIGQVKTNNDLKDKNKFLKRNLKKLLLGPKYEIDIIVINNKFFHAKKLFKILPKDSTKYKIKQRIHKGYKVIDVSIRPTAYIGKRLPEL